jgi:hypothetical protein
MESDTGSENAEAVREFLSGLPLDIPSLQGALSCALIRQKSYLSSLDAQSRI